MKRVRADACSPGTHAPRAGSIATSRQTTTVRPQAVPRPSPPRRLPERVVGQILAGQGAQWDEPGGTAGPHQEARVAEVSARIDWGLTGGS